MEKQFSDDIMGDTPFGRAALRKFGPVPKNFRIYAAGWIGKRPEDWKTMKVTGAEFRHAKRGERAGELCIPIPGTVRHTVVTKEEIAAASGA